MKSIYKILFFIMLVFALLIDNCSFASMFSIEGSNANVYWDKQIFNIYVEENSIEVKNLFDEWNIKSKLDYKFNYVQEQSNADIFVLFQDINYKDYGALTTYYYEGDKLIMVQIILPSAFLCELKKSDTLASFIVKHEIGHALGIFVHSKNKKDVMYPIKTNSNGEITKNDIKLLKNSKKEKKVKITNESYEKYKNDLPYLANIYKKSGQYDKAIEIYKKILNEDKDLTIAEYSLGYCYFKIKDYKQAETFLKSAYEKENNNPVFLNSYIRILCKQNKKKIADRILKEYLIKNPKNKEMPIIKDCIDLISRY